MIKIRPYILFSVVIGSIICKNLPAQTTVIENLNISTGYHVYSTPGNLMSPSTPSHPVVFSGNSEITYVACNEIQLLDGFSSYPTGTGYFHAQGTSADYNVLMNPQNGQVEKYEKVEFSLVLPTQIQQAIIDFVTGGTGINPFDPDQISVEATFISPTNISKKVFGFYDREFSYGTPDNNFPPSYTPSNADDIATRWAPMDDGQFKVRFSPDEIGHWKGVISVKLPSHLHQDLHFCEVNFDCLASTNSNKGYVEVGNNGYFKFSETGESFFPVGAYLGWANLRYDNVGFNPYNEIPKSVRPAEYDDYMKLLETIKNSGGNYVRVMITSMSWGLEWEELGNYSDRLPLAWELDRVIEYCEQNNIYVNLCISHAGDIMDWDVTDPNQQCIGCWDEHPYKKLLKDPPYNYPEPVDPTLFFTHSAVKDQFKKYIRYVISRWSYSPHIAKFELMNEGNQVGHAFEDNIANNSYDAYGRSTNISIPSSYQYTTSNNWTSPVTGHTFSYDVGQWNIDIASFIKNDLMTRQLITCSYALGPVTPNTDDQTFYSPLISTIGHHDGSDNLYANVRRKHVRDLHLTLYGSKPFIFEEIYPASSSYHAAGDPSTFDSPSFCNDVEFHNAAWATCFSGAAGTTPVLYPGPDISINPQYYDPGPTDAWTAKMRIAQFYNDNVPALAAFFEGVDFQTPNYVPFSEPVIGDILSTNTLEKYILICDEQAMGWVHLLHWYWGTADNSTDYCRDGQNNMYSIQDGYLPGDFNYGATPSAYSGVIDIPISAGDFIIEWYDTRTPDLIFQTDTITAYLHNYHYRITFPVPTLSAPITDPTDPDYCPACRPDVAFKIYPVGSVFRSSQIASNSNNNLLVNPNPNIGEFTVSIQSALNANPNLYLIDVSGRIIHTQSVSILEGLTQIQIYKPELPAGIYFIKVDGFDEQLKMIITK